MSCVISEVINNSKSRTLLKNNGANIIYNVAKLSMGNSSSLDTEVSIAKSQREIQSAIKNIPEKKVANSILYTGTSFNQKNFDEKNKDVRVTQIADAKVIKAIEGVFNNMGTVLSPTQEDKNRVIINTDEVPEASHNRTFFKIDSNAVEAIEKAADGDILKSRDGLEHLLISAMHRGFDVILPAQGLPREIVNSAVSIYTNQVADSKKPVIQGANNAYSSNERNFVSVDAFLDEIDGTKNKRNVPKIYAGNRFLSEFLTESERKMIKNTQSQMLGNKRIIAQGVLNTFSKFMPSLKSEVLTQYEIREIYGDAFADKKGFVIGGKIILNLSQFDSSTAFHEFGHIFLKWVKENNPELHAGLLKSIQENFSEDMDTYRIAYTNTHLKFSEQDIAEEIFVDRIGMKAATDLNQHLEDTFIINQSITEQELSVAVDDFTDSFVQSLLKLGVMEKLSSQEFDLDSTIEDMLNINFNIIEQDFDNDGADILKEFVIGSYSHSEVFNALSARGVIIALGDKIALTDGNGNIVNVEGKVDVNARYSYNPEEGYPNIIEEYLEDMAYLAEVQFSTAVSPKDVAERLFEISGREQAKADVSGNKMSGPTTIISRELKDKFDQDLVIIEMIHRDYYKKQLKKEGLIDSELTPEERAEVNNRTIEEMKAFPTMVNRDRARMNKLFDFKKTVGTRMHAILELFVMTMNYSTKIKYSTKDGKKPGRTYFLKGIKKAIQERNESFFDEFFFSRIEDKSTAEFKQFSEAFDTVFNNRNVDSEKAVTALLDAHIDFLNKYIYGAMKGPLVLIPELRVKSEALGINGIVDLVVVDGDGVVYSFDYKTKEEGKKANWDADYGINMKDEFAAYKSNARTEASIQTSMYNLVFIENGFKTSEPKVVYIDNKLESPSIEGDETENFQYIAKKMVPASLSNMTMELAAYFKRKGKTSPLFNDSGIGAEIEGFIKTASGGQEIDAVIGFERQAELTLARAEGAHKKNKSAKAKVTADLKKLLASMGGSVSSGSSNKGLKFTINNKYVDYIPANITTKEGKIKYIVKVLKEKRASNFNMKEVEKAFYSGDIDDTNTSTANAKKSLIRGTDSSTHTFEKVSSDISYGNAYSGFAFITNKFTAEKRLIIYNHERESHLKFGKGHDNIFGNFVSSNLVKSLFPRLKYENTNHNMRLVKAGLLIMAQKKRDPSFTINTVMANHETSLGAVPRLLDMDTIINMAKTMLELAEKSGEVLPKEIKALLDDASLHDIKNYMPNPTAMLGEFLESSMDFSENIGTAFSKGKKLESKEELQKALVSFEKDFDYDNLRASLNKFRANLERTLTSEQRKKSPLWQLTNETIISLFGTNFSLVPTESGAISRFVFTPSKASNSYQLTYNKMITASSLQIRKRFDEIKDEHFALLDAMAKKQGFDMGAISGGGLYTASMKKVFKHLYLDPENVERGEAYILKDYDDPNLSSESQAYLKFIHETFQTLGAESTFKKDLQLPKGWMPLVRRSYRSKSTDNFFKGVKDSLTSTFRDEQFREDTEVEKAEDKYFVVENSFKKQLLEADEDELQFGGSRRYVLGIDEDGNEAVNADDHPLDNIEDNIENAFDSMVMASLEEIHYRDTAAFGRAMYEQIQKAEDVLDSKTKFSGLKQTLKIMHQNRVQHLISDSIQDAKWYNIASKATTGMTIMGTFEQAILEGISNPMAALNVYTTDKIYGLLFKGNRDFSIKSFTKAWALVHTSGSENNDTFLKIEKLNRMFGITNSDTSNLKRLRKATEKNFLFSSNSLMFLPKLFMDVWQKTTMVAYLLENGSYDAYSLDEKRRLVYDETKDKMYFDSEATAKEQEYKAKAYEAVKMELRREMGGLTGDPTDYENMKLSRGLSSKQVAYLKDIVTENFSSLDESSKSLITFWGFGGMLSKMKTWLFPKISKYFQGVVTASEDAAAGVLVEVKDDTAPGGYRLEFQGQGAEGIFITVRSILRQLYEYRGDILKGQGKGKIQLKEYQKKNIAKLITDASIIALIFAIRGIADVAIGENEKWRKNYLVKLALQRLQMTLGDQSIIGIVDVLGGSNGSMLVSLSVTIRLIKAMYNLTAVSAAVAYDEEVEAVDVGEAAHKLMGTLVAPYRSYTNMYEGLTEEE